MKVGANRPVVPQPRAHRIGDRHGPFSHARHQAGHAAPLVQGEGQRIQRPILHHPVNHVDRLQSADRFEIDAGVENNQIRVANQRHPHRPGEITVLVVRPVLQAG